MMPTQLPDIDRLFFFNDTATTEIYTLSLHDALPIFRGSSRETTVIFFSFISPRPSCRYDPANITANSANDDHFYVFEKSENHVWTTGMRTQNTALLRCRELTLTHTPQTPHDNRQHDAICIYICMSRQVGPGMSVECPLGASALWITGTIPIASDAYPRRPIFPPVIRYPCESPCAFRPSSSTSCAPASRCRRWSAGA